MKLDLIVVDYSCEGFKRYAVSIVKEINKRVPETKIGAFYMSGHADYSLEGFDLLECLTKYSWNAKRVFDKYEPKAILVFGHRIFDYMFTIEAHRRGATVFNFQHGLYMEHTVISEFNTESLIKCLQLKRDKVWQYLKCIHYMGNSNIINTLKTLNLFLRLRSLYTVVNAKFGDLCHADYSFIYGEYWKEYYGKQFEEAETNFVVVGYPELEQATEKVPSETIFATNKPTLCYLAQSSVEDGVIKKEVMQEFLVKLGELTQKCNLVIKYHPRSNRSMYRRLYQTARDGCVYEWNSTNFPVADVYVGHESTIIARAIDLTEKTIICRLSNSRISPFERYTSYVAEDIGMLTKVVGAALDGCPIKDRKDLSEFVFNNKQEGAIVRAAEKICHIMRDVV